MAQKFPIDSAWFFNQLKEKGYSLRRFAGALGMDASAVSRMLNGQRNMSAEEQDRVAALLGLPLAQIATHRGAATGGFGEMTQAGYEAADGAAKPAQAIANTKDPYRHPIFGCMKGTMIIPDDLDLTAPADPDGAWSMTTSNGLLLDTCALIWLTQDRPVAEGINDALLQAVERKETIGVSAMSAWEIGMLIGKGRLPTTKTASSWFRDAVREGNLSIEPATPEILIAASYLPQPIHNDPADRIIIATARERNLSIMTRDRAILTYGASGHVKILAC